MSSESDDNQTASEEQAAVVAAFASWLVLVGAVMWVVGVVLEIAFPLVSPDTVALVLSTGTAVILWGIYPSQKAASGTIWWITLTGPAAIAVFLYFPMSEGLRTTPHRSQRTLFASNTSLPGSSYFLELGLGGGRKLRVFDVESLSNNKIVGDVGELRLILKKLSALEIPGLKVDKKAREFVSKTLEHIGLPGGYHDEALVLVEEVLGGHLSPVQTACDVAEAVPPPTEDKPESEGKDGDEAQPRDSKLDDWAMCQDQKWKDLVNAATTSLSDEMLAKRMNRFPYVIATVQSGECVEPLVLFAGDNAVAGKTLRVTAVANPQRKSVPGLMEAIVVELPQRDLSARWEDAKHSVRTWWWGVGSVEEQTHASVDQGVGRCQAEHRVAD